MYDTYLLKAVVTYNYDATAFRPRYDLRRHSLRS